MPELVLEVRCQELPAALLRRFSERLSVRVFEELMSRGITFDEMLTGATPRRLALALRGLPTDTPEVSHRQLGPSIELAWLEDGKASEALLGFSERVGVPIDELETVPTEKGEYTAAKVLEPGLPIAAVMTELLRRQLGELVRISDRAMGSEVWPTPVVGLVMVLDGEVLDGRHLDRADGADGSDGADGADDWTFDGQPPSDRSSAHTWAPKESFAVADWQGYVTALAARGVVVSLEDRRAALEADLDAQAAKLGGERVPRPLLLQQLAASLEIPNAVGGSFDSSFLALPAEFLVIALAERQQVFGLRALGSGSSELELLPHFVGGADLPAESKAAPDASNPPVVLEASRHGRERAVEGVLIDLRFYVQADRARPLAKRVRRLEQMTFHPLLGTFAEKGQRRRALVEVAVRQLGWEEVLEPALEASVLFEADLATAVVEAFPSLRGTAGGVYAREEGYVEGVWRTLYDGYRPTTAKGPIPRGRVGQLVAVADRMSTLVGYFGLDAQPTRRSDPHGLRPLAQGLLRIVLEAGLQVDLDLLAARAVLLYGERLKRSAEELLRDLQTFLDDRLDHVLGRRGYSEDEIRAAKAVGTADLPDLVARIEALHEVRGAQAFRSLVMAARSIGNIVGDAPATEVDPRWLEEEAEKELHHRLLQVSTQVEEASAEGRYVDVLRHLLELVPALDRFFADVLVMDENEALRANRIALLHACRRLYWRVGRLRAVEPETEIPQRPPPSWMAPPEAPPAVADEEE